MLSRYSEWLNETVEDLPDWNHVLARELYDYSVDPWEARNVAEDPKYTTVVHKLRKQLRGGWTVALPRDA